VVASSVVCIGLCARICTCQVAQKLSRYYLPDCTRVMLYPSSQHIFLEALYLPRACARTGTCMQCRVCPSQQLLMITA
jgi:hypothetical protein